MKENDVRERAFAMPLTSPAFPPGPYRFIDREYLIITYRTDPAKLRALVPEPLEIDEREPLVKYEFIRMPDSTGFGDYTETGQVIPVSFQGRKGGYTHCMFLNDEPPIAGGRELWGFPKKLASPTLRTEIDTLVGTLDYGPVRVATGTMGYKHRPADLAAINASLDAPNFLLKIIPHVDGSPRICELVEYHLEDIVAEGRLDRAGGARSASARPGAACRAAGAGGRLGRPHPRRSDARAWQGRARLFAIATWIIGPKPWGQIAPGGRRGQRRHRQGDRAQGARSCRRSPLPAVARSARLLLRLRSRPALVRSWISARSNVPCRRTPRASPCCGAVARTLFEVCRRHTDPGASGALPRAREGLVRGFEDRLTKVQPKTGRPGRKSSLVGTGERRHFPDLWPSPAGRQLNWTFRCRADDGPRRGYGIPTAPLRSLRYAVIGVLYTRLLFRETAHGS